MSAALLSVGSDIRVGREDNAEVQDRIHLAIHNGRVMHTASSEFRADHMIYVWQTHGDTTVTCDNTLCRLGQASS